MKTLKFSVVTAITLRISTEAENTILETETYTASTLALKKTWTELAWIQTFILTGKTIPGHMTHPPILPSIMSALFLNKTGV